MSRKQSDLIPDNLRELPRKRVDDLAVLQVREDGSEAITFAEMDSRSRSLANGLRVETGPGDADETAPIGLLAPTSPDSVLAALGILRAGRRIVPLDTQLPDAELADILDDCRPRLILTTRDLADRVRQLDTGSAEPDLYSIDRDGEDVGHWGDLFRDEGERSPEPDPGETAVIFYTSGTTGRAKGVPLTHRNLRFQLEAVAQVGLIRADERFLLPLPLHHVYPFVIGLLAPMALGHPLILPESLTGSSLALALRKGEPTLTIGVPRLYQAFWQALRDRFTRIPAGAVCFDLLLRLAATAGRIGLPLGRPLFAPLRRKAAPRLRMLASGGSPLDPHLARKLETIGWRVAIGYGLTETSPLLTVRLPGKGPPGSVGRAIEGVELKTDPNALPEGETRDDRRGELLAKGPNVFAGYFGDAENRDEIFTEDGFFRTGDIARIDDAGYVHLEGRLSTRIALQGGENVDPEKLEEIYAEAEGVGEIGILEDKGKLAALVVPADEAIREHGVEESKKRIRNALKDRGGSLPSYQHLARVEFTSRSLARTRLGKLRRRELEKAFESARSGESGEAVQAEKPLDPEEWSVEDRALLEAPEARGIWDLLCARYRERPVSPDAHLEMDLGIDSLEWVELSVRIESEVGLQLNEELIGRVSRVRDLLEAVSEGEKVTAKGEESRPLEDPESMLDKKDLALARRRGVARAILARCAYGIIVLWQRATLRIEARGLDHLPNGPCLLTPNHVSYLDAPCVGLAMRYRRAERFFWAGGITVMFANPFVRGLSRLAQVVPVDARRSPRRSLAFVALLLDRGHPLVWFPEGRVSSDGTLGNFQAGIGVVLAHRDVPVVPVHLEGTRESLPRGAKWPRRGRVRVTFGEPCRASDLVEKVEEAEATEIAEALRERVAALAKDANEND